MIGQLKLIDLSCVNEPKSGDHVTIDDYAKDGGPGEIHLLCRFYHESLRT